MAVEDNRQRYMPLPDDRLPGRGQPLDYPEAVLLVDPVEPDFKGEVFNFTKFDTLIKINKFEDTLIQINKFEDTFFFFFPIFF